MIVNPTEDNQNNQANAILHASSPRLRVLVVLLLYIHVIKP
jgi:hypothetical protein